MICDRPIRHYQKYGKLNDLPLNQADPFTGLMRLGNLLPSNQKKMTGASLSHRSGRSFEFTVSGSPLLYLS